MHPLIIKVLELLFSLNNGHQTEAWDVSMNIIKL